MKKYGVTILLNAPVVSIEESHGLIKKVVLKNSQIEAKNYVLATGGKSRPETGSMGDGFVWAKTLGHTVVTPDPALVPITIRNPWVRNVEGISLAGVRLSIFQDGKKYDSKLGKMLFTGIGLSGPLVLNMSKSVGEFLKHGQVLLSLDLFPTLDLGAVDRKLLNLFDTGKNRMIKNVIGAIVEIRLGHELLALAGIPDRTELHQVTREQRMTLAKLLKDIPMTVSGLLGAEKAIVTGGGIDLKEVDFATMRSKRIKNLFLAGDILDFDRPSGGFSLQICWTTGYLAGDNAVDISVSGA
jgi:predicted Rossmann fold flavoprotein